MTERESWQKNFQDRRVFFAWELLGLRELFFCDIISIAFYIPFVCLYQITHGRTSTFGMWKHCDLRLFLRRTLGDILRYRIRYPKNQKTTYLSRNSFSNSLQDLSSY